MALATKNKAASGPMTHDFLTIIRETPVRVARGAPHEVCNEACLLDGKHHSSRKHYSCGKGGWGNN